MSLIYQPADYLFASQRQRVSPFPNYLSMEAVCKEMKRYTGFKAWDIMLIATGNVFSFFQGKAGREAVGPGMAAKAAVPGLYKKLVTVERQTGTKLVKDTHSAHQTLKRRSDVTPLQLARWFEQYEKNYKAAYGAYGWVWMAEEYLMGDLFSIVSKRVKDAGDASDVLNILTKQPLAMVATLERRVFLELAAAISRRSAWKKLLVSGPREEISRVSELDKLIQKHERDFFWVTRDYEDPIISYEIIAERLKDALQADPKAQLQSLNRELKNDLVERQRQEKTLRLTAEERRLFASMRDAANLKELRKRYVSASLYYFDTVLAEIGRRTYMSIKQVRFMRTCDARRALLEGEDLTGEINERYKLSVWHTHDGSETVVHTGKVAAEHFAVFCAVDKNTTEFTGLPVSPGKAEGPVKIVLNPDECTKVEKGDIIVSIQVVPSFSTAIIKSAGIICDGGHGITSHPATLAREAGVPCIIQTRFAREILRDGDIVEVDGYKGLARIVKRKS
ncbi:MAG: Phosphoenolpyruvate synthase/pyruvate phosphate dikinase [Candidatus Magasanikbacteria bacterium GW2011_GWA2_56_11]|uniref:Phosphoenolpyruvate synthase/pyruvate phosphate dikinase n=1 Tax=Candidatus Magasanikbacteria bacterium GW2011_GWA2_56_11 TaxID=1619044 RepID=A0A0G1YEI0_9BACT|nr:MAG: Phosphoenolpyruvate synthase/pyruvate phosphate dikinase [Candidatus Magasanikbacteria bacterium GW2011_GWA2_56_11]